MDETRSLPDDCRDEPLPLEGVEQKLTLQRLFDCLEIIRSHAPRLSLAATQSLIQIAIQTCDCSILDLPTSSSLGNKLDISRSGASRILTSLGPGGRPKSAEDRHSEGHDFVETNDWIGGHRINAFVLSDKGRQCIFDMMQVLTGRDVVNYKPHDLNSLFKLLLLEVRPRSYPLPDQDSSASDE